MKIAKPSLSKDALLEGLFEHCEKIVGGGVLLVAAWLAWSGIAAIGTASSGGVSKPQEITAKAQEATQHVDKDSNPPATMLLEPTGLGERFAEWVAPKEKGARRLCFARPLFEELAKRTQPEVLAIEDLQAVAGIAVLAAKPEQQDIVGRARPPRGGDPFAGGPPGDPGAVGGEPQRDPAENVPRGAIRPYVVVTGLIPYEKQFDEYRQRFESTSFRDPQRDAPLWSDFLVERVDVTDGPSDSWERINLKNAVKSMQTEWAGVQADSLPSQFFLSPAEQPGLAGATYAWPLPQLAMQPWGPEAVHPWALGELKRIVEKQAATAGGSPASRIEVPGLAPGGGIPTGFGDPLAGAGPGFDPTGPPRDPGAAAAEIVPFKVFRFVDTAVRQGRQYRYRVRVSVWNPNRGIPPQHLEKADLATATKLPSGPSNETDPVTVPEAGSFLARQSPKELKRDTAEVLVLWPNERTGNYSLHSVTATAGGMVSVQRVIEDKEENRKPARPGKKNEPRIQSIPVGVLVDFIGQQAPMAGKPAVGRGGKTAPPAEPFEMILLADDGRLVHASAIGSEEQFVRYASTLPATLQPAPKEAVPP